MMLLPLPPRRSAWRRSDWSRRRLVLSRRKLTWTLILPPLSHMPLLRMTPLRSSLGCTRGGKRPVPVPTSSRQTDERRLLDEWQPMQMPLPLPLPYPPLQPRRRWWWRRMIWRGWRRRSPRWRRRWRRREKERERGRTSLSTAPTDEPLRAYVILFTWL